ncbi:ABC transporter substrate-binding protein [Pseudactinotalea sp. HY158]|uniref:ABC transporter substrate-binding protein n=1 Tax=Pseudactinotalea sp. HY158 TaxID=2654547 RepID=UPI00129CE340|nr:ABC transporter substrate-binding protein [Pseudactinotalea sp. HY158]QGH69637.1 ABC transporter substrate-binding protein [Pseudactinotalea sp. HY158]
MADQATRAGGPSSTRRTHRTAARAALGAGAVVATLVLGACSGGGAAEGEGASSVGLEGAAGGTLVYATGDAEPDCLDPHVGGNYPQALISTQYLEPLVGRDASGRIQPWLATDWEVSADGLTWDLTLADGITFTDGTPLDAEAVKVNIEHLQDPDTASSTGYLAVAKIETVEAVDATHVRFHLSEPDSSLLESLSQQWTAIQSPAGIARGMDANCAAPIGTGPFTVAEWVPQQHVILERNEDYATPGPGTENTGPAHLERIEWRFIPDPATRWAALRSGEVNVIDNPEPGAITAAEAGGDIAHIDAPRPGSVNRIELNSGQAPFDDIRVRQAFVLAADPNPGIASLYQGTATRSYSPLSSVEPDAYSDPDLFTTDPARANELLDEAGWTGRDDQGYRTRDGERLTVAFPVSTNQSVAAEQSLFEQIQANEKAVGFEVVLTPLDLSAWYEALAAPESPESPDAGYDYDAVSAPYTKVGPDVLRILYHSSGLTPAPSGYFANHAQIDDPALDALLEEAAAATDPAERASLYTRAQQLVLEGYYILPLYDQQNHFLVRGATGVRTLGTVATPTFVDARLTD